MLKKIIIMENGETEQFDTFSELVKGLLDTKYFSMSQEEKKKVMEEKALANCLQTDRKVVNEVPLDGNLEDKFLIKDEMTYILSLLKTNKIQLLERKDIGYDIFTKGIEVQNPKNNYIIVNKYANQLLQNYINSKENSHKEER